MLVCVVLNYFVVRLTCILYVLVSVSNSAVYMMNLLEVLQSEGVHLKVIPSIHLLIFLG